MHLFHNWKLSAIADISQGSEAVWLHTERICQNQDCRRVEWRSGTERFGPSRWWFGGRLTVKAHDEAVRISSD